MMNSSSNSSEGCRNRTNITLPVSPTMSAIMFAAGIFCNVAALVILKIQRRRDTRTGGTWRHSVFHILIIVLVITDLTGTCMLSPLVLLSYSHSTTLVGMSPESRSVCKYFGASMTFFTLFTMSLLFTMALERCFAIGYPYLYSRHVTRKCAYITIPLVFILCTSFTLLPFAGFGKYVQYCPGTWCFIDMNPGPGEVEDRAYAILYATVILVLVLTIVACNGFVVYQLFRMYQRRRRNGGSLKASMRPSSDRKAVSIAEEVEHLILLVFMTISFIICTLPLVIRVYINSLSEKTSDSMDLIALRFISINPIIDPCVFILLSPSVLHFCWTSICQAKLGASRGYMLKSALAKEKSAVKAEQSHPSLDYSKQFDTVENV